MSFTILSGGDQRFISTYVFDASAGSLALTNQAATSGSPSWITQHPSNSSLIYAIEGRFGTGGVQAFITTPDGVLSPAGVEVSSGGDGPAHGAVLSTNDLAVFNYNSGDGRIIPLGEDLVSYDDSAALITFPDPADGHDTSHPHQVVEYNGEVFVPDLGGDTIYRLTGGDGVWTITGDIPQPAGSGPRHIVFYDDYLYTLHELASTLSVQAVPTAPNGTSDIISIEYIVPDNDIEGARWQAAEILIPQPTDEFPTPYIYVSNRNTGTVDPEGKGDTIAIYEHVNKGEEGEKLELVNQIYTGLEQVRGVVIGEACEGGEKYLIASGVVGTGGVAVFERTEQGRNLVEVARNLEVETRQSFLFLC